MTTERCNAHHLLHVLRADISNVLDLGLRKPRCANLSWLKVGDLLHEL